MKSALTILLALCGTSAAWAAGTPTDPQIAAIVVTANQVDIDAGKLAQSTTHSPQVRDFAQLMVKDHTGVNQERIVARAQMRGLLEQKLDDLPEAFRVVFVLRSVEELSVEETAEVLGIPAATVRTRYFRAKGLLREALAQEIDLAERDLFEFGGSRCERIRRHVLERLEELAPVAGP